jgi:hypothetical protein
VVFFTLLPFAVPTVGYSKQKNQFVKQWISDTAVRHANEIASSIADRDYFYRYVFVGRATQLSVLVVSKLPR